MLGQVVVPLGRAPGDGAENAAVLLERHLQVALLQLARAVDDLDAARREHRPRIAGAERRQRRDAGRDAAGDAAERQVAVDPQARHQVLGAERLVGHLVDRQRAAPGSRSASIVSPAACLCPPNRMNRCAAPLERAEHVEPRDAAARAVRHAVFDRQHDRRPVERVHELRGDDADDAAVPALAGDDQDRPGADVRIGLDDLLRRGEDLGFFLLPADVLARRAAVASARASSPSASSLASSRRVAMSGVLMRPAALTRGASMNEM